MRGVGAETRTERGWEFGLGVAASLETRSPIGAPLALTCEPSLIRGPSLGDILVSGLPLTALVLSQIAGPRPGKRVQF